MSGTVRLEYGETGLDLNLEGVNATIINATIFTPRYVDTGHITDDDDGVDDSPALMSPGRAGGWRARPSAVDEMFTQSR